MGVVRNLIVAQSGGPTPVINSSLRGIIEAAREFPAIGTVYGARHGIEGVLKEELLDLSRPRRPRRSPCCGSLPPPARSALAATSSSRSRPRTSTG